MKKQGQMLWAKSDGIEIGDKTYGKDTVSFCFAKLAPNQYLVVLDAIFKKDPFKRKYAIVSERKFKSLAKNHQLQIT